MSADRRAGIAIAAGLCLLPCLPAQDILHYKFDGGCGATVVNYAAGSPAPATGTIVTSGPLANARAAGRFGLALAHSTPGATVFLETGWAPNVTGSLSWACWLRTPPGVSPSSLSGLFGNTGNGVFLLGSNQLITTGFGNSTFNVPLVSMASLGWLHLACVADGTTRQATYYFNGVAQPPLSCGPVNSIATSVQVGSWSSFPNTAFDIDEFLLVNRTMTAAEIAVLAADPRAADAPFGTSGGPRFAGNGQRPVPGNQSYGLVLTGNAGLGLLVFGSDHCRLAGGTIPLPANLGVLNASLAGVTCYVDGDLGTILLGVGQGATAVPFPLPNITGLSGFSCFAQALTLDATTNRFTGSNALAIGIGR